MTPGSEIVFAEATADPFGVPLKTDEGEHLMVKVIKSRDENYEWGGNGCILSNGHLSPSRRGSPIEIRPRLCGVWKREKMRWRKPEAEKLL